MEKEIKMVVRAVLDQGEKKDFKRVVWGTKTGENLGFGVCVPSRTFFSPQNL